jgi:hypothetical protein
MDIFNNNRICRNLFACMKQLIKSVHMFTRYMSIKWTKWAILNLSHSCPMMKHQLLLPKSSWRNGTQHKMIKITISEFSFVFNRQYLLHLNFLLLKTFQLSWFRTIWSKTIWPNDIWSKTIWPNDIWSKTIWPNDIWSTHKLY